MNKNSNFENIKINDFYTSKKMISEMSEYFEEEGFIQLNDILDETEIKKTKEIILKQKFIEEYKPMMFKKKTLDTKNLFNLETIKLVEYFKSKEFLEYIEEITNFELNLNKIEINLYGQSDFIIINDKVKREETIEVIYDISDKYKETYGGKLTYITKEEELIYLEPTFNTLTILYKAEELMKYLKYINNKAKTNKILRIEISFTMAEEL